MKEFTIIVEQDEDGWYIGTVAELPGCHTQAKTLDELTKRIKEAIQLYLEASGKIELQLSHFISQQVQISCLH
jgi:predicted RNase H-like HicB family nuclease